MVNGLLSGAPASITNIDAPNRVEPGESFTVEATVKNNQPRDGFPQLVRVEHLAADGTLIEERVLGPSRTLVNPQSSTLLRGRFTAPRTGSRLNIQLLNARTENVVDSQSISIGAANPSARITDILTQSPLKPGETFPVEVSVENTGPILIEANIRIEQQAPNGDPIDTHDLGTTRIDSNEVATLRGQLTMPNTQHTLDVLLIDQRTGDQLAQQFVTIQKANITGRLTQHTQPGNVPVGEAFTATATARNTGDREVNPRLIIEHQTREGGTVQRQERTPQQPVQPGDTFTGEATLTGQPDAQTLRYALLDDDTGEVLDQAFTQFQPDTPNGIIADVNVDPERAAPGVTIKVQALIQNTDDFTWMQNVQATHTTQSGDQVAQKPLTPPNTDLAPGEQAPVGAEFTVQDEPSTITLTLRDQNTGATLDTASIDINPSAGGL